MPTRTFLAFDVDNTLLDPAMCAYRETVTRFLETVDMGLPPGEAYDAFEDARAAGHALERLGLDSPIHDRGCPHGLAAFWLIHCADDAQRRVLGISSDDQPSWRDNLSRLVGWDRQTKKDSLESRLGAERRTRAFCQTDNRIRRFREEVVRLAGNPTIVEASQRYKTIEASRPVESRAKLMEETIARGLTPVIITEGRTAIQMEKVARCGLDASWNDRLLITEEAAGVPGLPQLDEVLSQCLDAESVDLATPPSTELTNLWYYRCIIDAWAHKTPWFFARCLHAIQETPGAPRTAIQSPVYVQESDWKPLRFVMVGDRYDKDVEPLIDLLGLGVGMKIRLRMGKYGHLHPEDSLDRGRLPDRTFTDWESLVHFLTEELTPEQVPPITAPPDIADRQFVTRESIEFGLQCELEAVQIVAAVLEAQMSDAP